MRIAIVNDLKLAVQVLRRLLITDEKFEIAWVAYDGKEAVEKCAKDIPDLILMDLIMPVMNGAEATKIIMKQSPCPILIVTASVGTNASFVFEAMGYGALDAVNTPMIDSSGELVGGDKMLHKINTIASLYSKTSWIPKRSKETSRTASIPESMGRIKLVIIGASTGGPLSLVTILKSLPRDHSYAIVIIQHIDEKFADGLAGWLQEQTGHKVEIAKHGGRPVTGVVHIAGTNNHLRLNSMGMYEYTPHPKEKPYRPSVDVFFASVAECWSQPSVAVLLTGMGNDGALGMKELFDKGWYTIAQSKESCIVFGMPRAAIELNGVSAVVHIDKMARAIMTAPVLTKKQPQTGSGKL